MLQKKPGALHPIEVLHLILLELPLKFIFKSIYVHLNNLPKEESWEISWNALSSASL